MKIIHRISCSLDEQRKEILRQLGINVDKYVYDVFGRQHISFNIAENNPIPVSESSVPILGSNLNAKKVNAMYGRIKYSHNV